jgi:hypothetical protein
MQGWGYWKKSAADIQDGRKGAGPVFPLRYMGEGPFVVGTLDSGKISHHSLLIDCSPCDVQNEKMTINEQL